jgi:hypothetical protein
MMLIMVAGPYSAPTEEKRQNNLRIINLAAARVAAKGHVPIVGVNAALPVVDAGSFDNPYDETMRISLALAEKCDAILCLGSSRGVAMEREIFVEKGLPVYNDVDEIP